MLNDEKSQATIDKYMHDMRCFLELADDITINKEVTLSYKAFLEQNYAITSANSMLAALNAFLRFAGWQDWRRILQNWQISWGTPASTQLVSTL